MDTTEEIVKALDPWLQSHSRKAWIPVVEDGDGSATSSKFCGTPWIGEGAEWPNCGNCNQPLEHFLQLNLDELPAALGKKFGTGLLQLFYCIKDDCQGMGGWEPFSEDLNHVRIVHATPAAKKTNNPTEFAASEIVGWTETTDFPCIEEHTVLGLEFDYGLEGNTVHVKCPAFGLQWDEIPDMEELIEQMPSSITNDKLGGWPNWVQGIEYPNCTRCGTAMHLIMQVDSQDNVPFMFGDMGIGHITQCPEHKDVVAFGWACS